MNLVTCIETIFIHIIHRLCDNQASHSRVSDIIWIRSLSFHHISMCCCCGCAVVFFTAHGKSIGTGSRNIHTHTHDFFPNQFVWDQFFCWSNLSWCDLNLIKFLHCYLVSHNRGWTIVLHIFTICSKINTPNEIISFTASVLLEEAKQNDYLAYAKSFIFECKRCCCHYYNGWCCCDCHHYHFQSRCRHRRRLFHC